MLIQLIIMIMTIIMILFIIIMLIIRAPHFFLAKLTSCGVDSCYCRQRAGTFPRLGKPSSFFPEVCALGLTVTAPQRGIRLQTIAFVVLSKALLCRLKVTLCSDPPLRIPLWGTVTVFPKMCTLWPMGQSC